MMKTAENMHGSVGSLVMTGAVIVAVLGFVANIIRNKLVWNSKWIIRMILLHKILGYLLIIIS